MSLENNHQYASVIKHEYLPPPLQNNYLSLFDIQVKMAKQFLTGTEEEKIATIKKRIKKFFDYGNDQVKHTELNFEPSSKAKTQYPPFEVNKNINEGLDIDCSKIILYGTKSANLEIAEKIFPGFIGSVKIDDCNIKLIFSTAQDCQNLLGKNAKDKGFLTKQHIKHPYEIQWFEIQMQPQQEYEPSLTFYARYVTNKDDILFENDNYFRKLLGRARHLIDQKQQEEEQRQKETQQRAKKKIEQRRKVTVKRYDQKNYSKDFDTITNYDGVYVERPYQKFDDSRQISFYESREEPWQYNGRQKRDEKKSFNCLDISEIKPSDFYGNRHQDKYPKRDRYHSNSRESTDYKGSYQKKRRPDQVVEDNPRDKLIKAHRDKSGSTFNSKGRFLDSYDYDKEIERKMSRSKKPQFNID